jgi:lipid-binding SYLF domain-containing protein
MLTLVAVLIAGVFSSARTRADDPAQMVQEARQTVATFKRTDPGLAEFFERSAGYAVFPTVGKAGFGVGGAHGTGVLFDRSGTPLGKTKLNQVSVGAQVGGQSYSQVIFFETPTVLADFKAGKFALSAQASAVALKSGASANAKFREGVAVFTATKQGLMFEASVGGQRFSFEPFARKGS